MADVKIGAQRVSEEDVKRGLELLEKEKKRKERIAKGEIKGSTYKKMEELTPEQQDVRKKQQKRQMAKQLLIVQKAKAAGITVTEKEIDDYIKAGMSK